MFLISYRLRYLKYVILNLITGFTFIGNGWCRPDGCDVTDSACRINGYYKDDSNDNDCKLICLNETSCTGYVISDIPSNVYYANRCFIYGNISSTYPFSESEWNTFQKQFFIPSKTKTSGTDNVKCYRRNGIPDSIQGI